ncbi:MAG: cytochrome c [Rhodobacteraceae bacterium]|nr:cytochrome c [Paracoccaceae bacterium]
MKHLALTLIATFPLATMALAHDGVLNPAVKTRMDIMANIKESLGVIADMAKGKTPFDAAKAETARQTLAIASAKLAPSFEAQETDPKSEALPAIWSNWGDFTAKANDLILASHGMDVSSLPALQDGLVSAGQTCRACHKPYREKK